MTTSPALRDPAVDFYVDALARLQETDIPFLVGGTFAFSYYSRVTRDTKDIDVFVRPEDCLRVLDLFDRLGYRTELPYPHWLGKIHSGGHVMDVIFNSGNAVARVDDLWFEHSATTELLGLTVRLCPVEEMIWSKAYIQERERFDGADVLHLIRETASRLDWPRLLMRFGDHWPVLFSHLILFGFVYPDRRDAVPAWVYEELTRRVCPAGRPQAARGACFGTFLSREQYLYDIEHLGYRDARIAPAGPMTQEQVAIWTAAIDEFRRSDR